MNVEAEIARLQHEITLVRKEGGRLNEAEWTLLMMIEHTVKIIDALALEHLALVKGVTPPPKGTK